MFLLLLIVFALGPVSVVPSAALGFIGVPTVVVTAVSVLVGAVAGLFSVAIGARAYVQLKPDGWSPAVGSAQPFA